MGSTKVAISKRRMIEALESSLGIVTTAAKAAGLHRKMHYTWLAEDPEYKEAYEALANVALDFAESNLHMLIKNGNPAATIFYLKTKGRARGYIERQDINVVESTAFVFQGQDKGIKKIMNVAHKKKAG